jgi:PTS system nitrogen regulatory IIA component
MQMSVADVAHLLCATEEDVRGWIEGEGLPAHHVGHVLRLDRAEVLGWAMVRGIPLSTQGPDVPAADGPLPSLVGALLVGGVHHGIRGRDRREVLRSCLATLRLPDGFDRDGLLKVLLARESLGSTGIGDGIAIPHVWDPIAIHLSPPAVALCFLETPVDFDAIDGKPVQALFLVTSRSIRTHRHLLSRLSVALRKPDVRAVLSSRGEARHVLEVFGRVEESMPAPWVPGSE